MYSNKNTRKHSIGQSQNVSLSWCCCGEAHNTCIQTNIESLFIAAEAKRII